MLKSNGEKLTVNYGFSLEILKKNEYNKANFIKSL